MTSFNDFNDQKVNSVQFAKNLMNKNTFLILERRKMTVKKKSILEKAANEIKTRKISIRKAANKFKLPISGHIE